MHNFIHEMLHNTPAAQRIMDLWNVCYYGFVYAVDILSLTPRNTRRAKARRPSL